MMNLMFKESISLHGDPETPSEPSKYYHDTDGVLEITETEYNQIYSSYEEKTQLKINWIELNNSQRTRRKVSLKFSGLLA